MSAQSDYDRAMGARDDRALSYYKKKSVAANAHNKRTAPNPSNINYKGMFQEDQNRGQGLSNDESGRYIQSRLIPQGISIQNPTWGATDLRHNLMQLRYS